MIDMSCVIVWIVEYYVYYLNCDIVLNGENIVCFVQCYVIYILVCNVVIILFLTLLLWFNAVMALQISLAGSHFVEMVFFTLLSVGSDM